MKGLLIKDWKLLKNQGRFFLLILIISLVMPLIGFRSFTSFMTNYLTFIFSLFVLSTLSYDSYDNGMPFLLSLPVSRKTYVQEKYVFALILTLGSWLISLLLHLVVSLISPSLKNNLETIYMDVIYLSLIFLFLSYSLPLHLLFGSEKGRILSFGILGLFSAGIIFGITALMNIDTGTSLLYLMGSLMDQFPTAITAASLAGCLIFLGISYCLSVKIMKRKEF